MQSCLKIIQKTKLDECISSIAKNKGYVSCDISKKVISTNGGNYLGVLYEIDVKGKTADGEKETAVFVKSMASYAKVVGTLSLSDMYKTELFVYKELSKQFDKLQENAQIPIDDMYKIVKCYDESYEETIFLENVTRRGFKTWNRIDIVTLDMAEVCIKQLARFHGLSFVLKVKTPDYFNSTLKSFKTRHNFGETWKNLIKYSCDLAIKSVEADLRVKIEDKLPRIMNKLQEYLQDESIMYCLCHGDYRPNNIMIREENGKVVEAIPIDYQFMYYGCPIIDFYYYMYCSTDYRFRKSYIVYLKNIYYETLNQFLQHFDISAESVLPRKVFENFYCEKIDYGLMITVLLGPFIFAPEDGVPDLTKDTVSASNVYAKCGERFRDRLKDTFGEFIQLGYF